jgi:hypothetical protein
MDEPEDEGWGRTDPDRLKTRRAYCRKAAEQLLKRAGVQEPPVPVEDIARGLGFQIRIENLPRGVDARLRTSAAERVIELASGQARVRHRFSIAHELGHAALSHRHGETDVAEQEANAFAGALLVPRSWLKRDVDHLSAAADLAARYDVSRDVIFIAVQGGGLLDRLK